CNECPLSFECTEYDVTCSVLEGKYPEEAVEIVQKWAEEHPAKTRMSDFFEKFPDAPRKHDGTPYFCPGGVYGDAHSRCSGPGCYDCWNRPLEGEK
ncbi:MAG: hypothetical protein IIV62_02455, partial [Anaerotignum sp.]|nr:hypothetical protein [Anaerotignum sp.]